MKNIEQLRALSKSELTEELLSLRKAQFELRMKRANGSLEKTHQFAQIRKALAQIKTLMTEKAE